MKALALFCLVLAVTSEFTTPIKHVIVLMEENRSFDHMVGFLWRKIKGLNGLTGKETNPVKGGVVHVNDTSPYIGAFDPDHSFPATTKKLDIVDGVPKMDGFARFECDARKEPHCSQVMNMFTPEAVPIISTLAEEFAIFDRFFCSFPGCTNPNRLFGLTATSYGHTDNDIGIAPQKTIYDNVAEAGLEWRHYYADSIWEPWLETLRKPENKKYVQHFDKFLEDAAGGTLPNFAWIDPRSGINYTTGEGSNDQHPDHDVRLGEKLMKQVYEALRASPQWNETLFIITYDEHGGFYDHVPPPSGVPRPDDEKSHPDKFDFERLGIRIPTLLISPWIEKGLIAGGPVGDAAPEKNSEWELSSISASVVKMFGLKKYLTKRDAWAGHFDGMLKKLSSPRTDCPVTLPKVPSLTREEVEREAALPINSLQEGIVKAYERIHGFDGSHLKKQGELSEWLHHHTQKILKSQ